MYVQGRTTLMVTRHLVHVCAAKDWGICYSKPKGISHIYLKPSKLTCFLWRAQINFWTTNKRLLFHTPQRSIQHIPVYISRSIRIYRCDAIKSKGCYVYSSLLTLSHHSTGIQAYRLNYTSLYTKIHSAYPDPSAHTGLPVYADGSPYAG